MFFYYFILLQRLSSTQRYLCSIAALTMASLCGLLGMLLLALAVVSNAAPMNYTGVTLGQYFWPSEPLVVTISAQQFDVIITNTLSGNLAVYLNDEPLPIVPAGATVYFEPSIAQGWIALNASFALLDVNTNATVAQCVITSVWASIHPSITHSICMQNEYRVYGAA